MRGLIILMKTNTKGLLFSLLLLTLMCAFYACFHLIATEPFCIKAEKNINHMPKEESDSTEDQNVNSPDNSDTGSFLQKNINDAVFPEQAAAAQQEPLGTLPSLGRASGIERNEEIFFNGFSLWTLGKLVVHDKELAGKATDYTSIMPLHPYFLKLGENHLQVFSAEEDASDASSEMTLAIAEWDYVYGTSLQETERLLCPILPFESRQAEGGKVFSWDRPLPQWAWQQGVPLGEDQGTKEQLYQEVANVHAALSELAGTGASSNESVQTLIKQWKQSTEEFIQASELRGKPYVLIDQVFEAVTKELASSGDTSGSLTLQPLPELEALQLEIFAGGTLAKLHNKHHHPLFDFTSNLPDGPRGRSGDTKLAFDLWYRKNHAGQWELDAIYPRKAPNTWSGFQIILDDLESLFRLTNF